MTSSRIGAYVELTKPRITAMVVMTTAIGYFATAGVLWQTSCLVATLASTSLLAAGTAALNQWYERRTDAAMRRTCRRPIPSGRILARRACWFGTALCVTGLAGLLVTVSRPAAIAGAVTAAVYLIIYTPLKRRSSAAVFVGAFAGAMPPVIGSLAGAGTLVPAAVALFSLMFVWQIPHVYAIAMLYRDDYERGGLKMLPQSGRASGAAGHVAAWSIALIAASLAPAAAGMAGGGYALCAIALGTLFAYYAFCFWGEPSTGHARRVLVASVAYLPAVLVLVLLDSVGRGL